MEDLGLPCVHCGLCLNTCPTYRVLGTEADSPRGRIYIMEAVKRGALELDADARAHLDACLGCLACETACPSGVSYGARIEEFRPQLREGMLAQLRYKFIDATAVRGRGLDFALGFARLMDSAGLERLRRYLPALDVLPGRTSETTRGTTCADLSPLMRSSVAAPTTPRLRVGLLTGCASDRMLPEINRDCVEVLHRNGIAVIDVQGQGCCGALSLHAGDAINAKRLARANARAFASSNLDFVVTTAAGCTATQRDSARLLHGADSGLGERTRDVCELLVEAGFKLPANTVGRGTNVAYHDACHLAHGCSITDAPRAVVAAATGRPPTDLGENEVCCGSAGSYNIEHPLMGRRLGDRKAELVDQAGIDLLAVGNAGCILQITRSLRARAMPTRVVHPVQLLADAYRASESILGS